jgi:hypothetical protein
VDYSGAYTAEKLIDYTLTWLLAGLVIAKVATPANPQYIRVKELE